jgi:hypothetical protein
VADVRTHTTIDEARQIGIPVDIAPHL